MAAMTVADDADRSRQEGARLEQEIAALQDARGVSADTAQATQAALIAAFNSAAERIEGMAKKLNAGMASANEQSPG